jgi:hypothetical protein
MKHKNLANEKRLLCREQKVKAVTKWSKYGKHLIGFSEKDICYQKEGAPCKIAQP